MKKFTLFFLLVMTIEANAQGGWQTYTYPGGYPSSFNFYDENFGMISDEQKIYRSINSGQSWALFYNYPENGVPTSTFMLSRQKIFVGYSFYSLGMRGELRMSNDSGRSFTTIFNNNGVDDIQFLNDNTGYLGINSRDLYNSAGSIQKTTNGGLTWTQQLFGYNIHSVSFINENTGWTRAYRQTGIYSRFASVLQTTNGGNSWTIIKAEEPITVTHEFTDVIMINTNTGFYYNSNLYKTTNGGSNWIDISPVDSSTGHAFAADFVDENTGWFAGDFDDDFGCTIYKTTNGGNNWILQKNIVNDVAKSIQALNSNYCWIIGNVDKIYFTSTGGNTTSIEQVSHQIPTTFSISQNYPNPFNPSTKIAFDIPQPNNVRLIVYNSLGQQVAELVNEQLSPGSYEYSFNGSNLASGMYFYTLETEEFKETKKMMLVK